MIVLVLVLVSLLLASPSWAQTPQSPLPSQAEVQVKVLEGSRAQCERALADMWHQALELESQLKATKEEVERLKATPQVKETPSAPETK